MYMTQIEQLYEQIIIERTKYLMLHDSAYPDVGFGLSSALARRYAIEQLIKENVIPNTYKE